MSNLSRGLDRVTQREGEEMIRIMAVRLAVPLALVIGLASPAGAQTSADTREEFACKLDLTSEIEQLPQQFREVRTTFDTEKLCPGNVPSENFKIDCFDEIEDWPPGLSFVDQNFTCFVSGTACGVPGTFLATGETMRFNAVTDPEDPTKTLGAVHMTCHFN